MGQFCKALRGDTEFGQVLVTMAECYDDDEGECLWPVAIRGEDHKGCVISLSMGYKHEAEQRTIFDGITAEEACNAVRHARSIVDQIIPDAPVEEKADG